MGLNGVRRELIERETLVIQKGQLILCGGGVI